MEFLKNSTNEMKMVLDRLKEDKLPVILFGAGDCGKNYIKVLNNYGIKIDCFCDDDIQKQKKKFDEYDVLSVEEAVSTRGGTILISSYGPKKLRDRLLAISSELESRILWTDFYLWEDGLDYYEYYSNHSSELLKVDSLLGDELSRKVFYNMLNYKISRNKELIEEINDVGKEDQYFPSDIVEYVENEVFVDLGAYTGDTAINFAKHIARENQIYKRIYAFEPDEKSFLMLKRNTKAYENIAYIPKGAYSQNTQLRFYSEGFWTSTLSECGNIIVDVCKLDDEISDKVTFLKADIEGSEMEAIKGASGIIARDCPKIAFCVYHKKDDIFRIPLALHNLNPNYVFYLRHYSELPVETVVYAIDKRL